MKQAAAARPAKVDTSFVIRVSSLRFQDTVYSQRRETALQPSRLI